MCPRNPRPPLSGSEAGQTLAQHLACEVRTRQTPRVKIVSFHDQDYSQQLAALHRRPWPVRETTETVAAILEEVRTGGDEALVRICNRYAQEPISRDCIQVKGPAPRPKGAVRKALAHAHSNVRAFARARIPRPWKMTNREGAIVGENFVPLQRVGVYVPGGTAPLVSTALMTVTLAKAAGVPEIVVCSPAPIVKELHYALELAGATEIYGVGGAQAVAAMAYGTETIAPVLKIFGPGNAYVVEAKRQLFGLVAVDLVPGPSEVAVVADHTCVPAFVAADLLAQAEHGPGSQILLATPEREVLDAVLALMETQLARLGRGEYLAQTLESGATLVHTKSLKQAIEVVEAFAPEHLSLVCRGARKWARSIRNSGAIFLGNYSPVAAGDYLAGPSHELPTGGAARAFAGLTVEQFLKRVSVVEYSRSAIKKAVHSIDLLACLEGLDAHARSATIRLEAQETVTPPRKGKRR